MDLKELQAKMHKKSGAIIKYDDYGNPIVSMPVGSIPPKQFEEFENVCKNEFNGNRWLMIWTLFLRSKNYDLEEQVAELQEKESLQEDDIETNELGLLNPEEK